MATYVGDEKESATLDLMPLGFYYYLIPKGQISSATYLGWVDTIQSLTYNPFIEEEDIIRVIECPFNTDKYGRPSTATPKCYRIESDNLITKIFEGTVKTNVFEKKNGSTYYDPKLQTFPFRYFIVTDYINPPMLIKPQLVKNVDNILRVKITTTPLSMQSKYNISVEGYKGDEIGNIEGMNSSNSLMLPVTSALYSQFISTSMASFTQGNINAMLENDLSLHHGLQNNAMTYNINKLNSGGMFKGVMEAFGSVLQGATSVITGAMTGGAKGAIMNGVNAIPSVMSGAFNAGYNVSKNQAIREQQAQLTHNQLNESAKLTEYEINTMAQAKITDMLNTPNSIKTIGNDTLFNLGVSRKKLEILEYRPKQEVIDKLDQYFKRYGYRYNRYDKLGNFINSRKYYNFVKTHSCNVATAKVPLVHLEEIKEIFNRGVTIWHIDNGATVGDYKIYTKDDNLEVE